MSMNEDKATVEQPKDDLEKTKKSSITELRANDFRLLKLTAVMVILTLISAIIHGRI
jgi:hypothetical protein